MLSEPRDNLINSKRNSIPTQGKVLRNGLRAHYRLTALGKKIQSRKTKMPGERGNVSQVQQKRS